MITALLMLAPPSASVITVSASANARAVPCSVYAVPLVQPVGSAVMVTLSTYRYSLLSKFAVSRNRMTVLADSYPARLSVCVPLTSFW